MSSPCDDASTISSSKDDKKTVRFSSPLTSSTPAVKRHKTNTPRMISPATVPDKAWNDMLPSLLVKDIHGDEEDSVLNALIEIKNICVSNAKGAPTTAHQFVRLGGYALLVVLASKWNMSVRIQHKCIDILGHVSYAHLARLDEIPLIQLGLFETVLSALDSHVAYDAIHRCAFNLIENSMNKQKENAAYFAIECQGITRVVAAMGQFAKQDDVLLACVRTLRQVSKLGPLRVEIIKAGGIQALGQVIQYHSEHDKLQALARETLANTIGVAML